MIAQYRLLIENCRRPSLSAADLQSSGFANSRPELNCQRVPLKPADPQSSSFANSYGAALAYPLYAWLLSNAPREIGEALHLQGIKPISQAVCRLDASGAEYWVVNLLTDEAIEVFAPILERAECAQLHRGEIRFERRIAERIESPHALIRRASALRDQNRFALQLLSPTAFKQAGRYVIYPQEALILQSLIQRWGLCFPEMPLDDPDATQALLQGIHIADYRLHTLRHPLKQTRIPAFQGRVVLEARLPVPLMDILNALYCFAPYAGIGIKTALGMGAVGIELPVNNPPV